MANSLNAWNWNNVNQGVARGFLPKPKGGGQEGGVNEENGKSFSIRDLPVSSNRNDIMNCKDLLLSVVDPSRAKQTK